MYLNENDRQQKIFKAKKDLLDALKSFNDLSEEDKYNLMVEMLGIESVKQFFQFIQNK